MLPESSTFQVDNAGWNYLNKLTVHCHCSDRVPQLKEELLVQILLMVIDKVIFPVQNHPIGNNSATSVSLRLPGSSYSSSVSSLSANHCVKPVQQRGPLQPVVCLTLWATQSVRRSGHISPTVSYKRVFFQLLGFLTSGWTNSCPQESIPRGEDECRPVRQIAPATNNEWQFIRLLQTINEE